MGLEGAVHLGFKESLRQLRTQKNANCYLINWLSAYEKAIEAAAHLEIDAVIDPADTRKIILKACNNYKKEQYLMSSNQIEHFLILERWRHRIGRIHLEGRL